MTVLCAYGRTKQAAVEDIRMAIQGTELSLITQNAIHELSEDITSLIYKVSESAVSEVEKGLLHDSHKDEGTEDGYPEMSEHDSDSTPFHSETQHIAHVLPQPSSYDPDLPSQVENIDTENDSSNSPHKETGSVSNDNIVPSTHPMHTRSSSRITGENGSVPSAILHGSDLELLLGTELTTTEQPALQKYYKRFKTKEFLLHKAYGLPSYIVSSAYMAEEHNFQSQYTSIYLSRVPSHANLSRSHVLYKIKIRDDGSLTCKARIAPYGNEDKEKENLKTDSSSCSPFLIRVLFSLCVIFQWYLTKIDLKGAILQSCSVTRDVYVIPPRECYDRRFIRLLNVATYGLVNPNANWQQHSDTTQTLLSLK